MSRASLLAQAAELERDILENWDKTMELSRAGLQAYLAAVLREIGAFLGQVGQEMRLVTGQPLTHKELDNSGLGALS
jgi:hypothetical protein